MRISIQLKATSISNVAGLCKDLQPFAVVTLLASSRDAKPILLGQTETLKNTRDPDFVKTFIVDYTLGAPANILVKLIHKEGENNNIPIGSAVFDVGSVLGAKGNTKAKSLKDGGKLFVRVQKHEGDAKLKIRMSGIQFKNTDGWFNKSDPFYEFAKKDQGHRGTEWNAVHRSSYIKDNLDPDWPEEIIELGILCDNDLDQLLSLIIYDHESSGRHELMGRVETSVNGLIAAAKGNNTFVMKRNGKPKGTVKIHVAEVSGTGSTNDVPVEQMERMLVTPSAPPLEPVGPKIVVPPRSTMPTFEDYVSGGCELSLSVAIDFTGSNGDPRKNGTLHFLNPDGSSNDYEKAIRAIGTILSKFDNDKKFPVWGFGAKYDGVIQHCFQCGPLKEVDGVQGVIDAYHKVFSSGLVMSGPTVVTEVLQMAAACAMSEQEKATAEGKQKYSILLILTDGAVSDVNATLQAVNSIANAPLSVVIVGIGNADFSGMQCLDDSASQPDIIQFVEFNAHRHSSMSLTSATLAEIPGQVQSYFQRNGIQPNPPVRVEEEDIVVAPAEEEIDLTLDFGAGGDVSLGSGGVYVPPGGY